MGVVGAVAPTPITDDFLKLWTMFGRDGAAADLPWARVGWAHGFTLSAPPRPSAQRCSSPRVSSSRPAKAPTVHVETSQRFRHSVTHDVHGPRPAARLRTPGAESQGGSDDVNDKCADGGHRIHRVFRGRDGASRRRARSRRIIHAHRAVLGTGARRHALLTRGYDRDLAMLGLVCRTAEGIIGATLLPVSLAFGAAAAVGVSASPVATSDLASLLVSVRDWNTVVSALFFAVGSTAFTWVMLRGRMIPVGLAWLGVVASALMVVALTLQLAGIVQGRVVAITSLPIVFFELPLGVWLIVKGVSASSPEGRPRVMRET